MAVASTAFWRVRPTLATISSTGSSYTTATGALVIKTSTNHNLTVGKWFYLASLTGTGSVASINGMWQATAGTAGTTINATITSGLGAATITGGNVNSGSNTNGGGYDCGSAGGSITPAATGTAGSWATVSTTTTFTDTTAAAFTSGMVGRAINIIGVGQFSVLSYVSTTQITITTPQPASSNFGANASWAVGPGTDYSQQNSAQASGTAGVTTGTTTFTDATALAFTAAMVGNAIYITGTGQTTGFYFVTAYTSSSIVTLDRSPGTGTGVTWHLGGGWADFWTNTTANIVPGNTVYVLGSGVPDPSSYTYDYTSGSYFQPVSGNQTAGAVMFSGDPATPSGGMPCIKSNGQLFRNTNNLNSSRLFVVASGANLNCIFNTLGAISHVVFDQFGYDIGLYSGNGTIAGCEVFSSVGKRSTNSQYAIQTAQFGSFVFGCNLHDCIGPGVGLATGCTLSGTIVAKCGGAGVTLTGAYYNQPQSINGCTIDGNTGGGIVFPTQVAVASTTCQNNLITNHTTASTYGMTVSAGTLGPNSLLRWFNDYNTFYNNTTHYNAIAPGAHDTVLTTSPYVASSTENYTLA